MYLGRTRSYINMYTNDNEKKNTSFQYLCLCLCLRGGGDGLFPLCLVAFLGVGGGDKDEERAARLFLSFRSLPGDLREEALDDANPGDGERRIRGGDGVMGCLFLCGDRDRRLVLGDLLRDLKHEGY